MQYRQTETKEAMTLQQRGLRGIGTEVYVQPPTILTQLWRKPLNKRGAEHGLS